MKQSQVRNTVVCLGATGAQSDSQITDDPCITKYYVTYSRQYELSYSKSYVG